MTQVAWQMTSLTLSPHTSLSRLAWRAWALPTQSCIFISCVSSPGCKIWSNQHGYYPPALWAPICAGNFAFLPCHFLLPQHHFCRYRIESLNQPKIPVNSSPFTQHKAYFKFLVSQFSTLAHYSQLIMMLAICFFAPPLPNSTYLTCHILHASASQIGAIHVHWKFHPCLLSLQYSNNTQTFPYANPWKLNLSWGVLVVALWASVLVFFSKHSSKNTNLFPVTVQ